MLWLSVYSIITKTLFNSGCCVSRLFFWDWIFRIYKKIVDFFDNDFLWYFCFLLVLFFVELTSNYVLWLSGHSGNTKNLLDASFCVSRLFFWVIFWPSFPWYFCFRISWRLTTNCLRSRRSKITKSLLKAGDYVSHLFFFVIEFFVIPVFSNFFPLSCFHLTDFY